MDLTLEDFAQLVGSSGAVTVAGTATREGAVAGVRAVRPPAGITRVDAAEMTVCCGAATPVEELQAALAEVGQRAGLPAGGTVGGALAFGRSDIRRLGDGPMRDAVLQLRYVSSAGSVVKAGGPTVKNVSGFDLCRLQVGARGTLGFLGEVILRTRPLPRTSIWYRSERDPWELLAALYRPTSILWDGGRSTVLMEGEHTDVVDQARRAGMVETDGPPTLPAEHRWSLPPSRLPTLPGISAGRFVAEVGVGIVHHTDPPPARTADPALVALQARIKRELDPEHRLNPGREPAST